MMWRGNVNLISKKFILNRNAFSNKFIRKNNFPNIHNISLTKLKFYIIIPSDYNFYLILNKVDNIKLFYIYNRCYYYLIHLPSYLYLLNFDKNTSVIIIYFLFNNNYYKLY